MTFHTVREIVLIGGDPVLQYALQLRFPWHYTVQSFADCDLRDLDLILDRRPALVVLDLDVLHERGALMLRELKSLGCTAPVLALRTGADVRFAVEIMRHGAADFVERPIDIRALGRRMWELMQASSHDVPAPAPPSPPADQAALPNLDVLTRREREVLQQVIGGASNKEIARRLGISHRTIEVHRANMMQKLGARNAADLVRIVMIDDHAPGRATTTRLAARFEQLPLAVGQA